MEKLNDIIGKNISALRIKNKMTQSELANKLNYTDKSVSKWENGDSVPPIETLKSLAELFNVSLDYLVSDNGNKSFDKVYNSDKNRPNKIIITLLAVSLIWFIAVTLLRIDYWRVFVIAVPLSFIVLLIFNCIFGKARFNYYIISCLIWTTLAAIYLYFMQNNPWLIFILGVPLQVATILWSKLVKNH